jgi:hypothetical protein
MRWTRRARRFPLERLVWFSTDSGATWRMGVSRSVSETGADIEGHSPPPVSASIRVVIALPSAGCLVGSGRVVRAHRPDETSSSAHFAVAIDRFSIERRDAILNGYTPVLHECQRPW